MRISGIEIHDTYGTREFKVAAFSVLRISGQNGSGKSSILKALGYVFGGGTDPSVIRKGAEQSVVCLDLDDGTKISKTTRPKRARKGGEITGYTVDLEIVQPDGTPRNAPQSYLNDLSKDLAIDPSILLRIDASTIPGRRALAAELLKLVPISFSPDEINRACSYRSTVDVPRGAEDAIALPASPEAEQSLDDLKKAAALITEQRRREGQIKSDTDGAITRLQKALPESALSVVDRHDQGKLAVAGETENRKALEDAEEFRRAVEAAISDAKLEVEKTKAAAMAAATSAFAAASKAINADIDAQIKALEAQRWERSGVAISALERDKAEAIGAATRALADLDAESRPQLDQAIERVTQAKDAIAAHARAATLREEIAVQTTAYKAALWKYEQLSDVLQRLEALRLEKLQHLPVAGLVVEDGAPFLDGIEWQNVNTSRKVEAIIQICCLQTGRLPLILWDDAEHGDTATRAAVESGLVEAGYQVLSALVSDESGLSIEVIQ